MKNLVSSLSVLLVLVATLATSFVRRIVSLNISSKLRLLGALSGLLLVSSCSSEDNSPTGSAASASEYEFNTSMSVVDVMSLILEPASDSLWDSAGWIMSDAGLEELYPTTDDGWNFMRAQAAVIVETGNSLALPGRAEDDDAWLVYSEGLSNAGIMAMEAAEAQNEEDFFQAGAQLYSVCTACHQAYNPDINSKFSED